MQQATQDIDRRVVTEELEALWRDGRLRAEAAGGDLADLWDAAAETLVGGKLVRPLLLLAMADALAGDPQCAAAAARPVMIRAAAGLEILHAAFLLHDDVIDADLQRRGKDNLIGVLAAREAPHDPSSAGPAANLHWANSSAILIGDLLLSRAHQLFARLEVPEARRLALLDLLEEATTVTVAGECLDVGLADGMLRADLDRVLAMTSAKTAAYTFELPLRMAAVLAGAPEHDGVLARAGRHLGLSYQLRDDLLSAFGERAEHGKDPLSDLREGKRTALVMIAQERPGWDAVASDLGRADLTEHSAEPLREHLRTCGAREWVEQRIEQEMRAAQEALRAAPALPDAARQVMDDLIERLRHRVA